MRPMRTRTPLTLISTGAVLLLATPSFGEFSLRQKQLMEQENRYFNKEADRAAEQCKMKLAASIDWNSFKGEMDKRLDGKLHKSFNGFCKVVLSYMAYGCRNDKNVRDVIPRKIKAYVCKFGGKGKRNISLKGSTLTFWVDWEAPNNDPYIKTYLGKKL